MAKCAPTLNLDDDWICDEKYDNLLTFDDNNFWNIASMDNYNSRPIKYEDVFQTDKADFKSGPTLAELNLMEEKLDTFDLEQLPPNSSAISSMYISKMINSAQNSYSVSTISNLTDEDIDYLSSVNLGSSHSFNSDLNSHQMIPSINSDGTYTESSICNDSIASMLNPSVKKIMNVTSNVQPLPSNLNQALIIDDSIPESSETSSMSGVVSPNPDSKPRTRNRNSSMSTDCSFSSHDEGFSSQTEDTDNEEDISSDDESFYGDYDAKDLLGATTSDDTTNKWSLNMGRSRKSGQKRYFWQYNVQSKGPKGTRIIAVQNKCNDPHVLCEAKDPVFSPDCHIEGVKHAGKARRGDGNDLTPNPNKLLMIGLELKKLSKVINELTPVAEVPLSSRNKSRKEKNKLASRACRLKKKAQHEANKIKYHGLEKEHKKMMSVYSEIRSLVLKNRTKRKCEINYKLTDLFKEIVAQKGPSFKVAGNTTDFVNYVLDNVASGVTNGGLDQL